MIAFAPWLMKSLGVLGTSAMFMVGGGILVHGFRPLDDAIVAFGAALEPIAAVGPLLAALAPTLAGMLVGVLAGAAVLGAVSLWQRLRAG